MMGVKTSSAVRRTRGGEASRPRNSNRQNRANQKRTGRAASLFAISLFCSGTAALVYQVLWFKQLSLVVGVEVYSISIAVSAFFAGLALGGFAIGRWADRLTHLFASMPSSKPASRCSVSPLPYFSPMQPCLSPRWKTTSEFWRGCFRFLW